MSAETDPNAPLQLRNGTEVPRSAAVTSFLAIKRLSDSGDMTDVMALYEARELARDPAHKLWPGTGERLRALGLIDHGGVMHEITRAVVMSSVLGAEMDLHVTWPVESAGPVTTDARDNGGQESER